MAQAGRGLTIPASDFDPAMRIGGGGVVGRNGERLVRGVIPAMKMLGLADLVPPMMVGGSCGVVPVPLSQRGSNNSNPRSELGNSGEASVGWFAALSVWGPG